MANDYTVKLRTAGHGGQAASVMHRDVTSINYDDRCLRITTEATSPDMTAMYPLDMIHSIEVSQVPQNLLDQTFTPATLRKIADTFERQAITEADLVCLGQYAAQLQATETSTNPS